MVKTNTDLRKQLIKIYDEINIQLIKSICFTSTSPQEGTTTIASALAKTVSSLNKKVLYCDFSDYETSLSKKLDKVFIESKGTIQEQLIKNIYFIEAYKFYLIPPPSKTILRTLHQEELKKFIIHLQNEYDLILVDTNYFFHHSTDEFSPGNLCQVTDGTILIVLSGNVSVDEVKQMTDKMKLKGIKIIGIVMNDINYPKLINELCEATHYLDSYFPKASKKIREWLEKSSLLKIEI